MSCSTYFISLALVQGVNAHARHSMVKGKAGVVSDGGKCALIEGVTPDANGAFFMTSRQELHCVLGDGRRISEADSKGDYEDGDGACAADLSSREYYYSNKWDYSTEEGAPKQNPTQNSLGVSFEDCKKAGYGDLSNDFGWPQKGMCSDITNEIDPTKQNFQGTFPTIPGEETRLASPACCPGLSAIDEMPITKYDLSQGWSVCGGPVSPNTSGTYLRTKGDATRIFKADEIADLLWDVVIDHGFAYAYFILPHDQHETWENFKEHQLEWADTSRLTHPKSQYRFSPTDIICKDDTKCYDQDGKVLADCFCHGGVEEKADGSCAITKCKLEDDGIELKDPLCHPTIYDRVKIPADLKPGLYTILFRGDAKDQGASFVSCADVRIDIQVGPSPVSNHTNHHHHPHQPHHSTNSSSHHHHKPQKPSKLVANHTKHHHSHNATNSTGHHNQKPQQPPQPTNNPAKKITDPCAEFEGSYCQQGVCHGHIDVLCDVGDAVDDSSQQKMDANSDDPCAAFEGSYCQQGVCHGHIDVSC